MKKNLSIVTLLASVSFFVALFGMQQDIEKRSMVPELFSQGILLFLDDTEKESGAITTALSTALAQQAGPLIASATVLYNVLSLYKKSQTYTIENIAKLAFGGTPLTSDMYIFLLFKNANFKPDQWIIKKIQDELYMLIPHVYLKNASINIASVNVYNAGTKISDTEKQLGLKVNHMETIKNYDSIVQSKEYKFADYFDPRTIFVTHADYAGVGAQPLWSLYLAGHGAIDYSVAALRIEKLKQFLNFLESSVNTKLLAYLSCYSAGITTERVYKDNVTLLEKTYNFAIMTQALTDAPVSMGFGVESINNVLSAKAYVRYDLFLKEVARSSESMDYGVIATYIFDTQSGSSWANTPQIKLPGIEWFSVLTSRKEVVSIGSILARARDADKALDVVTFFKTDPRALLLYAKDIPFELIINSKNLQAIISMVPGNAVHTIKKVSSITKDFFAILDWFMTIRDMAVGKVFFIENCEEYKNIIIFMDKNNSPRAYFLDKFNKVYVKGPQQKQLTPSSDQEYQAVLKAMKTFQAAQGVKPFETSITSQGIEQIKQALEPKKQSEVKSDKKDRLKKALEDYRVLPVAKPTVSHAIIGRLAQDVNNKMVDIDMMSQKLIDMYLSLL